MVYIYHTLFIHSSINGCLSCFYLLAFENNTAVDIGLQMSVQVSTLNFFRHIFRCGITGSYGNSMLNFLRNCHTVGMYSFNQYSRWFYDQVIWETHTYQLHIVARQTTPKINGLKQHSFIQLTIMRGFSGLR